MLRPKGATLALKSKIPESVLILLFFLPTMTSHTRIARDIVFAVRGRAEYDSDLRQDLSSSTVECITARRAELSEILSVFYVCCFHRTASTPTDFQPPQGELAQDTALASSLLRWDIQRLLLPRCVVSCSLLSSD